MLLLLVVLGVVVLGLVVHWSCLYLAAVVEEEEVEVVVVAFPRDSRQSDVTRPPHTTKGSVTITHQRSE